MWIKHKGLRIQISNFDFIADRSYPTGDARLGLIGSAGNEFIDFDSPEERDAFLVRVDRLLDIECVDAPVHAYKVGDNPYFRGEQITIDGLIPDDGCNLGYSAIDDEGVHISYVPESDLWYSIEKHRYAVGDIVAYVGECGKPKKIHELTRSGDGGANATYTVDSRYRSFRDVYVSQMELRPWTEEDEKKAAEDSKSLGQKSWWSKRTNEGKADG
jgi:hypothetical protein